MLRDIFDDFQRRELKVYRIGNLPPFIRPSVKPTYFLMVIVVLVLGEISFLAKVPVVLGITFIFVQAVSKSGAPLDISIDKHGLLVERTFRNQVIPFQDIYSINYPPYSAPNAVEIVYQHNSVNKSVMIERALVSKELWQEIKQRNSKVLVYGTTDDA